MNDSTKTPRRFARWAGAAGLLAAGGIAGGVLAGTLSANAATTPATPSSSSSSSESATEQAPGDFPAHGSAAHESAEKAVTGSDATKAQDAAVKSVGSGTAGAVTSDMTGSGFETTVTKSDGSTVEVHLDSSFAVETHGSGTGG